MKTYWITDNRFKFIAILLLIIFLIFISFLFIEAEAIKKNPCSYCAEKLGEDVHCTTGDFIPITRIYFENGTIRTDYQNGLLP